MEARPQASTPPRDVTAVVCPLPHARDTRQRDRETERVTSSCVPVATRISNSVCGKKREREKKKRGK